MCDLLNKRMAQKAILKEFSYSTKNPMTVRHASLLNAVKTLTGTVVNKRLMDFAESLSKKTKTDEILGEIFILKRDANWVKKMFMGANGINIKMVPYKKEKETKKEKVEVKKPKTKKPKNSKTTTK